MSVVIPAYLCEDTLPLTLASLAGQSYPGHLMEVVVVDDSEDGSLRLPDLVPENTRIVRPRPGGWGIANAFHSGVTAAEGEIVHRIDSDLVLVREHVEAQMRWHHLADYLVLLGHLRFNEWDPERLSAAEVHAAVAAGNVAELFDGEGTPVDRGGLGRHRRPPPGRAGRLPAPRRRDGVPAPGAVPARGRHGHRAAARLGHRDRVPAGAGGAAFVADRESHCRHLGSSTVMRRQEEVQRYTKPFMAERVPHRQYRSPKGPGRRYLVPRVEAVVTVDGHTLEDVRATVNALLASWMTDLSVTLVGSWSRSPTSGAPRWTTRCWTCA
nr:hypothetical protein GCM10020093_089610 [Planobispora longispora]